MVLPNLNQCGEEILGMEVQHPVQLNGFKTRQGWILSTEYLAYLSRWLEVPAEALIQILLG